MLRRLLWPESEEVTGRWRKLYNEVLHNLYYLLDIVAVMKSGRVKRERTRSSKERHFRLAFERCSV